MNVPKRKMTRALRIFLAVLGIIVILLVLRGVFFKRKHATFMEIFHSTYEVGDFQLDCTTGIYTLAHKGDKYLSVAVPVDVQKRPKPKCEQSDKHVKSDLCLEWENVGRLEVFETIHEETARCYNIVWTSTFKTFVPLDCISLSSNHWYGGSALKSQQWPLEEVTIAMEPYVSSAMTPDSTNKGAFGPVIERYWINSQGVGLFVDNNVPLHVSINDPGEKLICFKSEYATVGSSVYPNPSNDLPVLKYTVCKADNVKKVHKHLFKASFDLPLASPNLEIMRFPKYSTFSRFRRNITQIKLLDLVNGVKNNGFPVSEIDIEQGYERGIGDFNFNDKTFRNSHQMIGELKEAKYVVVTSVNPFIAQDSITFADAAKNKYFMMAKAAQGGLVPYNMTFLNKTVSLLDFTNSETVKWFKSRLELHQKEYMIDGFKFEHGDASFLFSDLVSSNILHNPCEYTDKYLELAHTFGKNVIVTSAHRTQKYPVYVEVPPRSATWDNKDGLTSLIPLVLTYGLLGYPYIIPGPIGGLTETFNSSTGLYDLPDRELFIRWTQMATYFPVMQFSVAPWQYDEQVVKMALDFVRIHETKVLPVLQSAVKEYLLDGSPLIRPVWWTAPEDTTALRIDCEFMVGDVLLVAPILDPGSKERDVYLPEGSQWEDQLRGKHYEGGQWLTNYTADLHEIPVFARIKSP